MLRRILVGVVLATAVSVLVAAAGAMIAATASATVSQSGLERIDRFTSQITVRPNGTVEVVETVDYDFGPLQRHGLERLLLNRFPYQPPKAADGNFERVTPISDITATSPSGAPADVDTKQDGSNLRIRVGDPDRTVTGRQTYVLRYVVAGAFNRFEGHDELYWNVTGNGWTVPIGQASATVTAPSGITQATCYSGPSESRLACESHSVDGSSAGFEQSSVLPGSGLTVVVALPRGSVSDVAPRLEEVWTARRAFAVNFGSVAGAAGVALAGVGGVGYLLARNGRDRRYVGSAVDAAFGTPSGDDGPVAVLRGNESNPVEFVPPEGIRPGHMGTLWDEVAHPLDVSAMIVDLAVRGYLRIEELEAPRQGTLGFGKREGDYRFVKLREADASLWSAERVLLSGLFRDGHEVDLSSLKTHFAERLKLVEGALYDDAVSAGWFPTRPDRVRTRWHLIGLGALVVGGGLAFLLVRFTHLGLIGLPMPLVGVLLLALGDRFPHRSAKGTALLGRVRGFKELFDVGEGERQRFAEAKQVFSQYLPYAIVFGMAEKWAATFEALGLSPAEMGVGTWYVSPYGYNPIAFGYAMSSFSTVTTGSIAAATPSSSASSGSSGFDGGGFSGGGFGGGGGGSW